MSRYSRVVLVGLMGAGKTSVGSRLSELLGWTFVDFDLQIERAVGMPITSIFAELGEDAFRGLERRIGSEALEGSERVLSTGGGWAAQPGHMEGLPEGTLSVWLEVSPGAAVRRAGGDRPLLQVPDPVDRAAGLLRERSAYYSKAELSVDTEALTVEEIAQRIAALVRAAETLK